MQISELMLKTIRTVHEDAVIIVKVGNFYNVYGQDAYIISYHLNKTILKTRKTVS